MDRTLVISDIHGCYTHFMELLHKVNYNPDCDRLILLGDYVDRGKASKDVVEKVLHMVQDFGVIAIRGNHDQRFVDLMLGEDECAPRFFQHGGLETLKSYISFAENAKDANWHDARAYIMNEYSQHVSFLGNLPLYYEDEHYIYVHAGLNPECENWQEQSPEDFMWIREKFIGHATTVPKIVVFGHTRTMEIQDSANIWFGGDKIGIDGGCSFGQQLNCLEIRGDCEYKTFQVAYM